MLQDSPSEGGLEQSLFSNAERGQELCKGRPAMHFHRAANVVLFGQIVGLASMLGVFLLHLL